MTNDCDLVEVQRSSPSYQKAKIGSFVSIKCYSEYPVKWYKEKGSMDPRIIFHTPSPSTNYTHELVIPKFSILNTGIYVCQYQDDDFGDYVFFYSNAEIGN